MSPTELLADLIAKPDVANAVAALGSVVLASVACVVSITSLYVAHATLKHQREHNVLSVRPIAYLSVGDYQDSLFVKLQNNGTGPLIIGRILVPGAEDPERPLVEAMPDLPPNVFWTTFIGDVRGRSIQPTGELVLLQLSAGSSSSPHQFESYRDKVREALGALKVQVEFTDIYRTRLPPYERELKWFHRTLPQA